MKNKLLMLVLAILFICLMASSCTSTPVCACTGPDDCPLMKSELVQEISAGEIANLALVAGKDWKLVQVSVSDAFSRQVIFDRNTLAKEAAGNIFILKITADTLSGTAAPNTYSGPYTINVAERKITVQPMRTTLMASLWQPEKLREHDYFTYLNNTYKWYVSNKKLLLNSKSEDGKEILLTYE